MTNNALGSMITKNVFNITFSTGRIEPLTKKIFGGVIGKEVVANTTDGLVIGWRC